MAATDIVRVKNLGTEDIVGQFNGDPFRIPAGGEALLDKEAAVKDFGNWESRNLGREPRLRKRDQELQRLRGQYGVVAGSKIPVMAGGAGVYKEDGYPEEVLADQVWTKRMPQVEIYLMDGSKVSTVLEDPEGKTLELDDATPDIALALESMKQQIAQLENARDSALERQAHIEVPTDSPENSPRPKAKKAPVVSAQNVKDD